MLKSFYAEKTNHLDTLYESEKMFTDEAQQHSKTFKKSFIKERKVYTVIITIHNLTEGITFLFINWVIDQKLFMSFSQIALFVCIKSYNFSF